MTVSYTVEPAEKLVYITFPRKTDLAEILEIMRQLASDDRLGEGFGILADAQTIDYFPSAKEVRLIAELASQLALASRYPTAMVVSQLVHYGLGNMLALITGMQGALVQPFYEVEAAKGWLRMHRKRGHKS